MTNIMVGEDGTPIEQDSDGAFRSTQEKADDSREFEEIVNGPATTG